MIVYHRYQNACKMYPIFRLSNQVMASLEDVKEMTATGLRHLADQRLYTDIKVDIKPSYFILPEHGKYVK